MDAKQAIDEGLKIYRNDMQILIRKQLQAAYGGNWCLEKVVPILPRGKRHLITEKLTAGESPERQVDVNDFKRVIEEFGDLFPEPIRQGEHHHRFEEITDARNEWAHPSGATTRRADAEAVLAACSDVLRQCGLLSSAQAIEDIVRDLGGLSTSAPSEQEVVAPNESVLVRSSMSAPPERSERRRADEDQRITSRGREEILEGLDIYRSAMSRLISGRLHATYGQNWFQEKVLPLYPHGRQARSRWLLDEGRHPESMIDVGDFPYAIREHGELFLDLARDGSAHQLMQTIAQDRNVLVHHGGQMRVADAEKLLDSCSYVLRSCGLNSAATAIDEVTTKPRAWSGPTRKIRRTDLVSSRLRAGFLVGVGLLISGLVVVIAFLVLQRDDSAVGSAQEQIRISGMLSRDDGSAVSQLGQMITFIEEGDGEDEGPTLLARGRIVVRIEDRAAGDYRIEFGFTPEWAMEDTETLTIDPAWFPTNRFLSESRVESAEDRGNHRWLRSSMIEIPADAATQSDGDGAGTIRGRVVVRYAPDIEGRGRLEFGFVPEWAFASSALGDIQDAAARHGILPRQRFLPIWAVGISIRLGGWLSSSVIEVPIRPTDPSTRLTVSSVDPPIVDPLGRSSGFGRCGSDDVSVYWFNATTHTRHRLDVTGSQATELFGASWWGSIVMLTASECDTWETGSAFGFER